MKITFIRPSLPGKRSGSVIEPLSMAILKAYTPKGVDLEFFDEFLEDIPAHLETDLVAMSVQTFTAYRSYQLADRFRKKGIPVVMGGYHPSLVPEEASAHADSVVIGDAEKVWARLVNDAEMGGLKKQYHDPLESLKGVAYDRSIFQGKKYSPVLPIEFNRGCKYDCDFCSISVFNHHKVKSRPADEVIEEMKRYKNKYFLFIDDNLCTHKKRTEALFEAMIPLKKKWGCQISIDALKEERFIELMAKSGCILVMVGFESMNVKNLQEMNKKANLTSDYLELVKKVKKYGIMVWGSFVFGYEHDDPDVFRKTYAFAKSNKLCLASFNTLNPMPGTNLYERMKQENRLLDDHWWLFEKYKYGEIMFRPESLSIPILKEECVNLRLKFNSVTNILSRAFDAQSNGRNLSNLALFLASNFTARKQIHSKMKEIL